MFRTVHIQKNWCNLIGMCNIQDIVHLGMESTVEFTLVRAAEAEVLPASGVTLLADAGETEGALTSNRSLFEVGSAGAPPHFHSGASELFFVLDGSLDVLLDKEIVTVTTHDLLVVPAGMPHAFAPSKERSADVLFVYTPSKPRFDYYRLLERLYTGAASPQELTETQDRFDNHYVDSPVWEARG
jgi:mannose-6-phosphate isomerase-like protein (cupin superfamily)